MYNNFVFLSVLDCFFKAVTNVRVIAYYYLLCDHVLKIRVCFALAPLARRPKLKNILDSAPIRFPPWKNQVVHNCTLLCKIKKSEFSPLELRALFYEHYSLHNRSLNIFTGGSKSFEGTGSAFLADGMVSARKLTSIASSYTAEL